MKGEKEKDVGFGFINLNEMIGVTWGERRWERKILKSFINYSN